MYRELIILCLIVAIYCMLPRPRTHEAFEDEHLYENESMRVMKSCDFALECCPSTYSNDRGCMCMEEQQMEVFGTRGFNSDNVD